MKEGGQRGTPHQHHLSTQTDARPAACAPGLPSGRRGPRGGRVAAALACRRRPRGSMGGGPCLVKSVTGKNAASAVSAVLPVNARFC